MKKTNLQIASAAREALSRKLVQHPRFNEALEKIKSSILFPSDTKVLLVVGPTGVGKSRLLQVVQKAIGDWVQPSPDPGQIPCVALEVQGGHGGHRFNWKEYYLSYLEALQPALAATTSSHAPVIKFPFKRSIEQEVLNALQHRRPAAALIDEANHFTLAGSSKVLLEQMTRIKSFANQSRVLHICFGTYELASFTKLSGQLARRCEVIHLSRYRACSESPRDYSAFRGIIESMQKSLPIAHFFDLATQVKYLHERSIGCVGILMNWLMRALAQAHQNERQEITLKDLEATEFSAAKLNTMLREAIEGESQLKETQQDIDTLRENLGHDELQLDWNSTPNGKPTKLAGPNAPSGAKRPFETKPQRHPVGGALFDTMGKLAS